MIEDAVSKFHELFIQVQSAKVKIEQYEETMQQLDKVFSSEDDNDERVIEQLRRLGNNYLQ